MTRSAVLLAAFALGVLGNPCAGRSPSDPAGAAPERAPDTAEPGLSADTVPAEVHAAADQGRYWRASRLMDRYLATTADTSSAELLLAARLAAGWGDWDRVAGLLGGRDWLESAEGGAGLELLGRARIGTGRPLDGARLLGRYLEVHPGDDRERGVAELRRAAALAHDSTGAALRAYDRAADLLPWFRDWVAMMAVEAAAAGGDTAAVRTRLPAAGSLVGGRGWRLRLDAALAAGDTMAAREVALATARNAGPAVTRATAWAELGRLRLAAGDSARGRLALEEALETPAALGAVTAARMITELGPTSAQWRRIGDVYARHGNPRRAAEAYGRYLDAGLGDTATREGIRLQRGRALFNLGRYDQAERELLSLADQAASDRVGAQALYLAGRAQYRQGRSGAGQSTLARLPDRFPGQPEVTEGLYLLADLKHDDLEIEEARRYYRRAAEASPSLYEAGLALMRLGGLELLEEDYEGALEVFQGYRALHPRGRRWEQATYWAARTADALDRPEQAMSLLEELRARDPLSYYGMRASRLLGRSVLDVPLGASPDGAGSARVAEGLRRVDMLAELGRRGDLVEEVERLRDRVADERGDAYALAEALNARGYTLTGIDLGWDLYRREGGYNPRLLRIIYPFPFRDLILPESRARGLDPHLVAGIIRRESAFNPVITSGAGAIGLMQIMPETGRSLAREVELTGFEPELLRQPEVNVYLGTRYLEQMLERHDGVLPLVLSAYNAGPTRATAWREFPEARDDELFMERVPFAETRDYIRNVLLHREVYRALYPELGRP